MSHNLSVTYNDNISRGSPYINWTIVNILEVAVRSILSLHVGKSTIGSGWLSRACISASIVSSSTINWGSYLGPRQSFEQAAWWACIASRNLLATRRNQVRRWPPRLLLCSVSALARVSKKKSLWLASFSSSFWSTILRSLFIDSCLIKCSSIRFLKEPSLEATMSRMPSFNSGTESSEDSEDSEDSEEKQRSYISV